jgi:class 3 adenylate cyclase
MNINPSSQANNKISLNASFIKISSTSRRTKILRIIRIIRLSRLVKLYKNAIKARGLMDRKKKKVRKEDSTASASGSYSLDSKFFLTIGRRKPKQSNVQKNSQPSISLSHSNDSKTKGELINKRDEIVLSRLMKESTLGKTISESITKKVIIVILIMLLILPLLTDDFFNDGSQVDGYSLLANYLDNYYQILGSNANDSFIAMNLFNNTDSTYPLVNITLNSQLYYINPNTPTRELRSSELKFIVSDNGNIKLIYSSVADTSLSGVLSILKTIYVCILLTFAAYLFDKDARRLIIEPLEIMVQIVDAVTKDPIAAKNTESMRDLLVSSIVINGTKDKNKRKEELIEKYEVKMIQSAIIKISALLAIGFGEAGGEIIKNNLSSQHDLDPMLKGKKKVALFGFCDIREFAKINEALQERTMVFVNEIAEIVHSSVDLFGGAANKNIGDAFLIVWKLPEKKKDKEPDKSASDGGQRQCVINKNKPNRTQSSVSYTLFNAQSVSDMAVLSYLKTIISINKDNRIIRYRDEQCIQDSLTKEYKVNMGFGLHFGWAIEGAIGSRSKIDASYLSPNVNIAARLEAATRQYGVTLLLSGDVYDLCTIPIQKLCRHIDTVEVKGSKIPLRLFTIDVNLNIKPSRKHYFHSLKERQRIYAIKKASLLSDILEYGNITNFILSKKSFKELLKTNIPKEFYKTHYKAMHEYLNGDWLAAKRNFQRCLEYIDDKPTKVVMEYMNSYNYIAPENWLGFRSLFTK